MKRSDVVIGSARRAATILATMAFLATMLVLTPGSTRAGAVVRGPVRTPTAPPVNNALTLLSQTQWVTAGAPFSLDVAVRTQRDPAETDLAVTIFSALSNRSEFQQSLLDRSSGSSLVLERRPLAEAFVAPDVARIVLPVSDPAQRRYFLRQNGVYPVRVELRESSTGSVIERFTTHLINVPNPPPVDNRLNVTTILPAASPYSADGFDPAAILDEGNAMGTIGTALAGAPEVPIALLPDPASLERLTQSPDPGVQENLRSLTSAAASRDVIKTTWTPVPAGMYNPDLTGELERQFKRGADVVSTALGPPRQTEWVSNHPLDTVALTNLQGRGMQRLVLAEAALAPQQRPTTLARPFAVSLGRNKGAIPTMQADAGLASHFTAAGGGALAAHRLLADIAVIWNDLPSQNRIVAILPPSYWRPDAVFLNTFFTGLKNNPVVAPVGLDTAFAVPPETGTGRNPLLRPLAAPVKADQASGLPVSRIKEVRQRLSGFGGMVDATSNPAYDALERRLLFSESALLSSRQRTDALNAANAALQRELDGVNMPLERNIRLTARRGEIPVSIQNDGGYPVRVVVRLTSDKLAFPQGSTRTLLVARQHVTEAFAVDARTSGAFPVQVRLESPDGSLVLTSSRVTVRSTAASGVGLALSVGAGAVLIIWWARSLLKSRRLNSA